MSENIKQEDLIEKDTTSVSEETPKEEETTEQDPLRPVLEQVQKTGKTEAEKAAFSLKKNAERAKELGVDVEKVLGVRAETPEPDDEDDKPLTVGMYKKIQQAGATKTALQLADDIPDATERELVKHYLENRIQPSGDPNEDLKDARRMVNAVRNEQIIAEQTRKTAAKTHSTASGADAINTEMQGELTPQEKLFMQKPFSMTKEAILKLRPVQK